MNTSCRPSVEFSSGTLTLANADAELIRRVFGLASPWTWDARAGNWRCNAADYIAVREALAQHAEQIENHVRQWTRVAWPAVDLPTLRPEQQAAVAAWLPTRRGVVVMPTGTGKTEVALSMMQQSPVSTLIVAPVRDLMYQWHRRILKGLGYDAGIVGDSLFNVRPVCVTTYDSACIHMERLGNQFGMLIFDECHHLPGTMRREAALMSAAPWRVGLSATPERSDGRHADLEQLLGPTVYRLELAAVRGKTLADYEVLRIPVHLEDKEQQRYDELSQQIRAYMQQRREVDKHFTWEDLCADYTSEPAARQIMKSYREKQSLEDRAAEKLRVLEDLFRLHVGSAVIIFAGSNAMARDVSRRFLIPCLLSHCGKRERLEMLDGLQSGRYPALVANQVLDEGVDLPSVKIAVVIGGRASTKQAKQRLGRVLRKSGNAKAILYEVVCAETTEAGRSRQRRTSDAFEGTRFLRRTSERQ